MFEKSLLIFLIIIFVLLGYSKYTLLKNYQRKLFYTFLIIIFIWSLFSLIKVIYNNYTYPKEWDYLTFFIDGHIAKNGLNFYQTESYKIVINNLDIPLIPSKLFNEAVINVGFNYPPPTMFIFLPLGFFNFNTSHMLWLIINIFFLFADIFLLWKIFFDKDNLIGLLLSSVLFLILPATWNTIYYEQTSFILLFFILLLWKDKKNARSGIWLAIGIFIKPFVALLFLFFLLNRLRKQLYILILNTIVICLLTIIIFSPEIFFSYFTKNPNSNVPNWQFIENINQSLLSTILRLTHYEFGNLSPLTNPIFIIVSCIILTITIVLTYRFGLEKIDWAFNLFLLCAILLYPGTLSHYSVFLIIPIIYLFKYTISSKKGILFSIIFASIIYFLLKSDFVFIANCITFIAFIGLYIWNPKTTVKPNLSYA